MVPASAPADIASGDILVVVTSTGVPLRPPTVALEAPLLAWTVTALAAPAITPVGTPSGEALVVAVEDRVPVIPPTPSLASLSTALTVYAYVVPVAAPAGTYFMAATPGGA